MMTNRRAAIATLLFCLTFAGAATATELNGPGRAVDGNSIEVGGVLVHLQGIDAPDEDQTCERDQRTWPCGQQAGWALAERLERHWVLCDTLSNREGASQAGEISATCYLGGRQGINVNAWMVEQGWALSDPATNRFPAEEQRAQAAGRGLWSGNFEPPWSRRQRRGTGG